jgi:hypothetical protein
MRGVGMMDWWWGEDKRLVVSCAAVLLDNVGMSDSKKEEPFSWYPM